jgi:Uma2 family endonuclease
MGVPTIKTEPMTLEEYFAFTDTRPDNEKWELIDGEPILHAPPSGTHHRILKNLVYLLAAAERVRPGLGRRYPESV